MQLIDHVLLELINENSHNKAINKIIFIYLIKNEIPYDIIVTGCNFNFTELNTKQLSDIKQLLISQENFTVKFE